MIQPMTGNLVVAGHELARGGFLYGALGEHGLEPMPSRPIYAAAPQFSNGTEELLNRLEGLERLDAPDASGAVRALAMQLQEIQRAITAGGSAAGAFPVRENLEAEAKILVPMETPVRNMLPRTPGSGLSSHWRVLTSLGGGYGQIGLVPTGSGGAGTTQTINFAGNSGTTSSTAGGGSPWNVGDWIYFERLNVQKQITAITAGSGVFTVTFSGSVTTTDGDVVINLSQIPGTSGRHADGTFTTTNDTTTTDLAVQSFYSETGAPEDRHEYYVDLSATYKLLGSYGSITGLAMAAGKRAPA